MSTRPNVAAVVYSTDAEFKKTTRQGKCQHLVTIIQALMLNDRLRVAGLLPDVLGTPKIRRY